MLDLTASPPCIDRGLYSSGKHQPAELITLDIALTFLSGAIFIKAQAHPPRPQSGRALLGGKQICSPDTGPSSHLEDISG